MGLVVFDNLLNAGDAADNSSEGPDDQQHHGLDDSEAARRSERVPVNNQLSDCGQEQAQSREPYGTDQRYHWTQVWHGHRYRHWKHYHMIESMDISGTFSVS